MNITERIIHCIFLSILTGVVIISLAHAESLSGSGPAIFSGEKHYQQGDLITVIISESAQAEQSASTELSKEAEMGYSAGGLLGTIIPSADFGLNSEHEGKGSLSRQGKMKAMVGAVVEEVFANGNLKIKGEQAIIFDSGTQIISVEGIVRPRDISSQNEVYSYKLANANIQYSGQGALHEKARTGYLSRILDILWIF